MSPRRKSISDNDLITAAARVVASLGDETRLSDVATEVGLSPATLIQRFGSREALMSAVGKSFIVELQQIFGTAGPPLETLREALVQVPVSRHFCFFALRPTGAPVYSLELRKQIAFCLANAVEAGDLAPCDVAETARRLQLAFYGYATALWLEGPQATHDAVDSLIEAHVGDYR